MYHLVSAHVHLVRALLGPLDTFPDLLLALKSTTAAISPLKEPVNGGIFPPNEFD